MTNELKDYEISMVVSAVLRGMKLQEYSTRRASACQIDAAVAWVAANRDSPVAKAVLDGEAAIYVQIDGCDTPVIEFLEYAE
jgi:hypothetical protein